MTTQTSQKTSAAACTYSSLPQCTYMSNLIRSARLPGTPNLTACTFLHSPLLRHRTWSVSLTMSIGHLTPIMVPTCDVYMTQQSNTHTHRVSCISKAETAAC